MNKNLTVKREFVIGQFGGSREEKVAAKADTAKIGYFLADENDIPDEYVCGPLVERLHEFEKLGMEPEELQKMKTDYYEQKLLIDAFTKADMQAEKIDDSMVAKYIANVMDRKHSTRHYGLTMSERSERKMIDDILDKVTNEKNLTLSIFISDKGTSIDVRPYITEENLDGDTERQSN